MRVAQCRDRFAAARVARLATVDADGRPHLVPLVFAVDTDVIYSAVDAKPKRSTALRRLANAAVTSTATSGASRLRLIARTFASFHSRAPRAIHGSQASAARTPGTLLAAMAVPVPVQHITTPRSTSPWATAAPTAAPVSGHWSDSATVTTSCPWSDR